MALSRHFIKYLFIPRSISIIGDSQLKSHLNTQKKEIQGTSFVRKKCKFLSGIGPLLNDPFSTTLFRDKPHPMKKHIFTVTLFMLLSLFSWAQSKPLRIVFDVTSNDTLTHKTALRHANGEASDHPDGRVEIVVYSGSLDMVVAGKSTVAPAIQELIAKK